MNLRKGSFLRSNLVLSMLYETGPSLAFTVKFNRWCIHPVFQIYYYICNIHVQVKSFPKQLNREIGQ